MNEPPKNLGEILSPQSAERLDSWKEIASHLDRSVRTVRRWEENENLPVRRHHHGKGSTVFALKSELDAWLAERFVSPKAEVETVTPATPADGADGDSAAEAAAAASQAGVLVERVDSPAPTAVATEAPADPETADVAVATDPVVYAPTAEIGSRGLGWGSAAVVTLAAVLFITFASLPQRARELAERPRPMARVLVGEVAAVDDSEVSADVVSSLLLRELGRSPVFELVSGDQVASTLDLMRRSEGASLDADTALRVSWRMGDVDALFVPKVERVGRRFVVDLDIVDPVRGVSVTHVSESFDSIDELMPAVRNLSSNAARIVASRHSWKGEAAPAPPRVTTASTEALRLYAEADQLRRNNRVIAAERILRRALHEDPEFVSAYLQLAWSLYERGHDAEEIREALAPATRHARDASAEEQLFLQASLDFFESRPREALSTFDALLTLAPSHYWGNRTAGTLCWAATSETPKDCLRYPIRMAQAAPDSAQANFEAAWSLALWADSPSRAEPFIAKARELVSADGDLVTPVERARIELFPVYEQWLAGDSDGVIEAQTSVADRFDGFSRDVRTAIAKELGYLSLALGRNGEAEAWFRRLPDPAMRHEALATLVFTEDDPTALAAHLKEGAGYRDPMTPLLFSMAGLNDESEALLAQLEAAGVEDHYLGLGRGLNAMAGGDVDGAIDEFHASVEHLRPDHRGLFFAGADLLAVAFSKKGDLRRAVATLETVAGHRRRAAFMGSGVFWMKCQLRLAGFYREIGREEDAHQIETQLLDLLGDSDADYPMRARLESLVG